jgi:hypothetical protein
MAAEIVGIEKINKYISRFDFQKIKLSKGSETLYIKKSKENETKEDLIEDFNEFVIDNIDDNNFRDYKLELFGTYATDPNAKLSPVVKVAVAFHNRDVAATTGAFIKRENNPISNPMDVEKYIAVATENATLKAQIDRLEEKLDELISDDDDDEDEVGATQPQTITEAINGALIGKIDTIVDVVLGMLAKPNTPASGSYAINGIAETDNLLIEFRKVHPEIDDDIARFYKLATEQPQFFTMVIQQLRKMV